ncbi:uncharacterized protein LOC143185936 [Calliopsis andreniformis]|uniref:uncharacterized protein LOC143185936 n=1 Tax=Calliopsis andreniformis TaxID=337506 RepID=UPI003FCD7412
MDASLKILVKERGQVKAGLTRFKTYFESLDSSASMRELQERTEKLSLLFDKFESVQSQIEMIVLETELEATHAAERESFENMYFRFLAAAKERVEKAQSQGSSACLIPTPNVSTPVMADPYFNIKLPALNLPTFDGAYDDWVRFRDTFESLIHNNDNLSNIQKFHYLNSPLKAEAARTIKSLGLSDVNYVLAWKGLKDRYDDSQTMIQHHIKALFDMQAVTKSSYTGLRQLFDDYNNHLLALKSLNEPVDSWGSIIVYLVATKLDFATKREWDKRLMNITGKPTWTQMTEFLESQCKYLEKLAIDKPITSHAPSKPAYKPIPNFKREYPVNIASYVSKTIEKCVLCNEEHALFSCSQFQKLTPTARSNKVRQLNLCFNCLQPGHRNKACSRGQCRKCGKKHHTALHVEDTFSPREPQVDRSVALVPTPSVSLAGTHFFSDGLYVLLATAIVYLEDCHGRKHKCRALLDPGSQSNFLTEEVAKNLGLSCNPFSGRFTGLARKVSNVYSWTQTRLHSRVTSFETSLRCLVIPRITDDLPNVAIDSNLISIPSNLKLADPHFYQTGKIDILLGGGLFWKLLCVGQTNLGSNLPTIQKTQLGWIVAGGMCLFPCYGRPKLECHLVTNEDLQNQLKKFWAIEEPNYPHKIVNNECEAYFEKTTIRDNNGRFVVKIPFKPEINELGNSRVMAEKRFYALERKFCKNPAQKGEYCTFMKEYEDLGHMTRITDCKAQKLQFFLPHHAVFKQTSTTTKLRVVFDGSAKTSSGLSLNEVQQVGPTVQDDLMSIALRFRKHKYVLSADIEKMYRQVQIAPEERRFQRILWRPDDTQPIQTFELNTVTYGTASAPFLATRALRQLGEDHAVSFPSTSRAIIKDFYVDDLLTGANSIDEARKLRREISDILHSAGFPLRKWASNDSRILDNEDEGPQRVEIKEDKDSKTLGLLWIVKEDALRYSVTTSTQHRITKRTILSETSKIFDPLGLVGPATIRAKVILQKLWQLKVSWDESLPQDLHTEWECFHHQLALLNQISIPRCAISSTMHGIEMHGFCDASEQAYGACIYLKSINTEGQCTVRLLCAKSRVAPLKAITLPRLELCGALLLSQLVTKVKKALEISTIQEYYWCDSTIVLAWIRAPSTKWKTFVANRTAEIQRSTNKAWSHVKSEENPADIISRGIQPAALQGSKLWWYGPSWLSKGNDYWPKSEERVEDVPECREYPCVLIGTTHRGFELFEKFSSYNRLIRVTAYCLRFISNIRKLQDLKPTVDDKHDSISSKILNVKELEIARKVLLKLAQRDTFATELHTLRQTKTVSKSSRLRSLNPFLDPDGLIRLGGRLANAKLSYDERFPIILYSKHPLTDLIILHEHSQLLHGGCQLVIASIRRKYCPLSCRLIVRNLLRKCIRCFRVKPNTVNYTMGDLPASRVTPSRAFSTCGVDYAGPFPIREKSRCRVIIKAYLCVFVCFVTKAVHLELASDLSTQAFLNCLRRFIARRGKCNTIYSDNGTNFVGARNELNDLGILLLTEKHRTQISDFCTVIGIQWHFIPPHAPHFGGLWESAVKSAKYHLKRVVGQTNLTFEELYTMITQVESCMNSRPLCPLTDDPSDLTPLTPSHFLIGGVLTSLPEPDLRDVKPSRLIRYQHLQYMLQHFWTRWQKEYLHQLQQRNKWMVGTTAKFGPGTLVIVKDDNAPPLKWHMGRIMELHPGKDNVTRVVSIKLSDSVIKRPVTKICILPLEDDSSIQSETVNSDKQA